MREKGPKFNPESVIREIYDERDSIQNEHTFFKRVILWYAMLSYAMVWYGKYGMLWYFYDMLWDFYAMVYVVKD